MSGEAFALGLAALITVLLTVVLWNLFATARAKMSLERTEEYQRLAERAVDAQERTAAALTELTRRSNADGEFVR